MSQRRKHALVLALGLFCVSLVLIVVGRIIDRLILRVLGGLVMYLGMPLTLAIYGVVTSGWLRSVRTDLAWLISDIPQMARDARNAAFGVGLRLVPTLAILLAYTDLALLIQVVLRGSEDLSGWWSSWDSLINYLDYRATCLRLTQRPKADPARGMFPGHFFFW
jgi:hypothetical protein